MNTSLRARGSFFACALTFTACSVWAAQAGKKLFINGEAASSDIRTINGRAYVPLADVAQALHMALVSKPDGIYMAPSGGANQVEGTHGKIGALIFTGKWRFTVNSIQQMDEYTPKYSGESGKITPRNAGETLFVVDCRIKNGLKQKQEMIFTRHRDGRTALTDDQEHSYEAYEFDAHNETGLTAARCFCLAQPASSRSSSARPGALWLKISSLRSFPARMIQTTVRIYASRSHSSDEQREQDRMTLADLLLQSGHCRGRFTFRLRSGDRIGAQNSSAA